MAVDQQYKSVKIWLQAMGYGTPQMVFEAMDRPNPYSEQEVEATLDELVLNEPDEFEKIGGVYRSKKTYRPRTMR